MQLNRTLGRHNSYMEAKTGGLVEEGTDSQLTAPPTCNISQHGGFTGLIYRYIAIIAR